MISEKRIKEILKPKAYKEFWIFMAGQTVVDDNGTFVQDGDFLRFVKKQKVID